MAKGTGFGYPPGTIGSFHFPPVGTLGTGCAETRYLRPRLRHRLYMQPVPKACLRHRLVFLPGTLGHEYKVVAFFLPNLYYSSPSTGRPPPPSISARAPSHSRAAAATSSRRRLFLSALGPAASARTGGPRPSSALARANLTVDS